jgi:hypothetical protein
MRDVLGLLPGQELKRDADGGYVWPSPSPTAASASSSSGSNSGGLEEHEKRRRYVWDDEFGSNLMLVCALGSRYSDDRRVLLDEEEEALAALIASTTTCPPSGAGDDAIPNLGVAADSGLGAAGAGVGVGGEGAGKESQREAMERMIWHSSGWKWFSQVQLVKKTILRPPGLEELQFHCVSATHFCYLIPFLILLCAS